MCIMGLRASAQEIRYAILENDENGNIVFKNKDTENRIKYPVSLDQIEDKLQWVKTEIDRIIRINPDIEKIFVKVNEYTGNESSAKRLAAYIDAIFFLSAKENNICIESKLNSQIASTSEKSMQLAETRVGKTDKYWNKTIADAILAAYWGVKNGI